MTATRIIGSRELLCSCGSHQNIKVRIEDDDAIRVCRNKRCGKKYRIKLCPMGERWSTPEGPVVRIRLEEV